MFINDSVENIFRIIDELYKKRNEINIEALAARNYTSRNKIFLPYDLHDEFLSFAKQNIDDKEAADKLISYQGKLRTLYKFQDEVEALIQAIGYLGQRSDEISEYLYKKIRQRGNRSYFLAFCLTFAAQINPLATKLLLNLWKQEDIQNDNEIVEGLRDSRRIYCIASPSVIEFLLTERMGIENGPIPIFDYMNRVLGDNPLVKCQTINKNGEYEYNQVDFSNLVLALLVNNPPYDPVPSNYDWLSKWCKNDSIFKSKALKTINENNIEYDIVLLSRYLQKEINAPTFIDKKGGKLFEKNIKDLLSKDQDLRMEIFKSWQNLASNVNTGINFAKFAFDYVEINKEMLKKIVINPPARFY